MERRASSPVRSYGSNRSAGVPPAVVRASRPHILTVLPVFGATDVLARPTVGYYFRPTLSPSVSPVVIVFALASRTDQYEFPIP
jgi:hypothetical protein